METILFIVILIGVSMFTFYPISILLNQDIFKKYDQTSYITYRLAIILLISIIIYASILENIKQNYYNDFFDFSFYFLSSSLIYIFIALFLTTFSKDVYKFINKNKFSSFILLIFNLSIPCLLVITITKYNFKIPKEYSKVISDYKILHIDSSKNVTYNKLYEYELSYANNILSNLSDDIFKLNYVIKNSDSLDFPTWYKHLKKVNDSVTIEYNTIKDKFEIIKQKKLGYDSTIGIVEYATLIDSKNEKIFAKLYNRNNNIEIITINNIVLNDYFLDGIKDSQYIKISRSLDHLSKLFFNIKDTLPNFLLVNLLYEETSKKNYEKNVSTMQHNILLK